ncbi:MAG: ATP-binding cassette domain-containing protein [Clostridia bacterium]|nr:ATP-binding cassette domain-containing protein [Clostridia bacterium]
MLILNDISKTFNPGTVDAKLALNHVSLTVNDGDFITIIGANGAGKSTLFNAVCGSFVTDTGTIFLDGKNITMLAEHKRARVIGRLFQDPMRGTAPDMSIEENLSLAAGEGGWLSHMSLRNRREFRERLALLGMGLEDRLKQPVGLLSGGQRQALTLLMATYHPPKLLLLDEHTAALDPGTARKVLELTASIVRENGLTCLMITHNMQDALDLGNRTIMMGAGEILYDLSGPTREKATVQSLVRLFSDASGKTTASDRMLLGLDLEADTPDEEDRMDEEEPKKEKKGKKNKGKKKKK